MSATPTALPFVYSPPLTRAGAHLLRNHSMIQGSTLDKKLEELELCLSDHPCRVKRKRHKENISLAGNSHNKVDKIELSADIQKLDGAPVGDIYSVTVLSSHEFSPSSTIEKDLENITAVTSNLDASSWAMQYDAIDSIRRFALFHQTILQSNLEVFLKFILFSVGNLRSTMSRNALLCLKDMFQNIDLSSCLGLVIPSLLLRTISDKKFLSETSFQVLDQAIESSSGNSLLIVLGEESLNKNPNIVNSAGIYTQKCLRKMKVGDEDCENLLDPSTLIQHLSRFLACKVVECRSATKYSLQCVRKQLGEERFVKIVEENLQGSTAVDVLRDSKEVKAPVKAKLSLRERMLLSAQRKRM